MVSGAALVSVRRAAGIFCVLAAFSALTGCITSSLSKDIDEGRDVRLELIGRQGPASGMSVGSTSGMSAVFTTDAGGEAVRVFHFDGALISETGPRHLRITVPIDPASKRLARVTETADSLPAHLPAERAVLEVQGWTHSVDHVGWQKRIKPEAWAGGPRWLVVFVPGKNNNKATVQVVALTEKGVDESIEPRMVEGTHEIDWVVRSRGDDVGRHLLLPLAVVGDVVTSPVQLVGYLVIGHIVRNMFLW